MRALTLPQFGREHLKLCDVAAPRLVATQTPSALLELRATALNYRDLLVIDGTYDPRFALPLIPFSDAVGVVCALTPGDALGRAVGQRVIAAFAPRWRRGRAQRACLRDTLGGPRQGAACEALVIEAEALVPVPEHLSDFEATALPCAATTAYSALVGLPDDGDEEGAAKRLTGNWVLCLGTGGVAVCAAQIARALGAHVAVVSSSDEKLHGAAARGATLCINYRRDPQWGRSVRAATGGVEQVIEVGGRGTLTQSLLAVRPFGTVSLIGTLSQAGAPAPHASPELLPAVMNQLTLQGVLVGPVSALAAVTAFYARHRLVPVVDRVFALSDATLALQHFAAQRHVGKVALDVRR